MSCIPFSMAEDFDRFFMRQVYEWSLFGKPFDNNPQHSSIESISFNREGAMSKDLTRTASLQQHVEAHI